MDRYATNDIDEYRVFSFVGKQAEDGDWLVVRVNEEQVRYAGKKNNPKIGTYEAAWNGRLKLRYGLRAEAVSGD